MRSWIYDSVVVGAAAFAATTCLRFEDYRCKSASDCNASTEGRCESGGSCSYADSDCASGRRWSEHALKSAGSCVAVDSGGDDAATSDAESSGDESSTTEKP